jgi:hypothetical protein
MISILIAKYRHFVAGGVSPPTDAQSSGPGFIQDGYIAFYAILTKTLGKKILNPFDLKR